MSKNESNEIEFGVKDLPMMAAESILNFSFRIVCFVISMFIFLAFAHVVYEHLSSGNFNYSFWDVFFPALGLWFLREGMIGKLGE